MTTTPRGPGMWEQATSTRGGRVAVGVAIALACLLALTAGVALAASGRSDRSAPVTAQRDDSSDPQGNAKGNGQGNAKGNGQGNGQGKANGSNGDLESIPGRLGGTLHGEVTRPTAAGGTESLLVQTGSVTASSAGDVTVKSTDGFTETYAVSSATQVRGPAKAAGLTAGTQVTVVATKDGKRALLVASKGGPS